MQWILDEDDLGQLLSKTTTVHFLPFKTVTYVRKMRPCPVCSTPDTQHTAQGQIQGELGDLPMKPKTVTLYSP